MNVFDCNIVPVEVRNIPSIPSECILSNPIFRVMQQPQVEYKIKENVLMQDIVWYAIGSMAAFLTMLGFVPQIIKIIKTKLHQSSIHFSSWP